jgi:hypothetical protein
MRAAALTGTVVPGDPNGDITPEEHNRLDESIMSPFTSRTHSETIATRFAESRGPGGIVLRLPIDPASDPEGHWTWVQSPDAFGEEEILLRGIRMDAEVIII